MNKNMSFSVSGQRIELTESAMLVAGTVNEYTARFTFDAAWDGYQRTAVFSCGDISREQLLTDDACTVPWEVLVSNGYLRVGVYGTNDGSRLPTIWTERRMYINPGAGPTQEAADPSPTLVEQLLGRMGDLSALKTQDKSSLVAAINEVWSSGGSGGASVTDAAINEDGHLIITLSTGKTIDAGYAVGPAGADGHGVPTATAADAGKVPVVQEDGSYGLADRIAPPATAQVGQTIVVKAVDVDGKPTEWEAADMASGTLGKDDVPVYLGTIPVSPDTALYLVAPVKDYKKVVIVKERASKNNNLTSYLYARLYQPETKKNFILAASNKTGYSFLVCKLECVSNDFVEGEIVYTDNATLMYSASGMIPHSSVFSNSMINQNMPIDIDSYYYEFHVANPSLAFDGNETVHVWGWKR